MRSWKCPNLVLQSVLLTTILLDLGVDIFHQRVPLHQHVSEGGTGEDTHHLRTDHWRVKRNILKQRKTFELRGGNPSKLWKMKRENLETRKDLWAERWQPVQISSKYSVNRLLISGHCLFCKTNLSFLSKSILFALLARWPSWGPGLPSTKLFPWCVD